MAFIISITPKTPYYSKIKRKVDNGDLSLSDVKGFFTEEMKKAYNELYDSFRLTSKFLNNGVIYSDIVENKMGTDYKTYLLWLLKQNKLIEKQGPGYVFSKNKMKSSATDKLKHKKVIREIPELSKW
ncbi:MAG: hypothetical protein Q4P17_07680 [Methanobacterium sp.]|nr:hypothetical protein [Methanobacterium sp.]